MQSFLSVDPLAASYASWSPYNYVLGNPILLVDPTGMAPEWIPSFDDDNNLILTKEAGDNYQTLKAFLGQDVGQDDGIREYFGNSAGELWTKFQNGKGDGTVNLGNDNSISKAYSAMSNFSGDETTNCFDCALDMARGADLSVGSEQSFRNKQVDYYGHYDAAINYTLEDAGSVENMQFGKSVIMFGEKSFWNKVWQSSRSSDAGHAATYLGKGQDGSIYTFSRNGFSRSANFGVFTTKALSNIYGPITGWRDSESGFYNPR